MNCGWEGEIWNGPGLEWKERDGAGAGDVEGRDKKKALCGNRRPSNDCLPYEKK